MNVLSPYLPASPPGRFAAIFRLPPGGACSFGPRPALPSRRNGERRQRGQTCKWYCRKPLAKRSAPRSLLAAPRRSHTGIEDGSGDRNIKSAIPYEKSHECRLIYYTATRRMNKDWQFPAAKRIDNFAEQLCGGQNDVAFGRNPFGAFRFASWLRTAHHHNAHRMVRRVIVQVSGRLDPSGTWTKYQ